MKKKVLSLLVTFAMVFSMFPATALAAEDDGTTIDLSQDSYTIESDGVYTVIMGEQDPVSNTLTIKADASVRLQGVNITAEEDASAISIESGDVTLIVEDGSTLIGGKNGAGIYVAEDASVTIKGEGTLTAIGNAGEDDDSGAAGIGGTWTNGNSGAITIDGATVVAEGYGVHGSGIGSGSGKVVGEIKIINGADVTAQGGYYADGEGTKLQSKYGKTDPEGGAAIGGGGKTSSTIADITIDESTVVANGGSKAAGIGANFWSSCGTITISGDSDVTAQGGSSSAGIGTSRAGDNGVSSTIVISGGTVEATGGDYGAGIGGGYNNDSLGSGATESGLPETSITISGGIISAAGGEGGAGIGGGYKTDNVDINITGGSVTAEAGALVSGKSVEEGGSACGIGSGANGSGKFENSPAVEIGDSATVNVTAYYGGKAAIEGMTTEDARDSGYTVNLEGEPEPLVITTADELAAFRDAVNAGDTFEGKTVKLAEDIDLGGEEWTPIASFAGEFDGDDHTISNFYIDATASSGGFFKVIEAGEGERVHDLTLSDVTATVGAYRFGTLANTVKGIVNRVTVKNVTVTTTHTEAWVGGMCAFMSWPWMNDCTVENLTVNAEDGADLIGGFSCILQKNSNMVFDNNDVKGFRVTVTDTDSSGCGVGGFVTQTQRGWEYPKIINSDITGIDVTAAGLVDVGGFIAWPGAHTTAEDCSTAGKVDVTGVTSGDCFAGGFFGNLGWNADLGQMGHVVTDCSADVNIITSVASAGGFVGSATNSNDNSMYATFNSCTASGDITSTDNAPVGGFAGDADRGVYNDCTATGAVSGFGYVGGFIGHMLDVTPKYDGRYPAGTRDYLADATTLDSCTGSNNVTGAASKTAGLIGYVEEGADVTLNGNNYSVEPQYNPVNGVDSVTESVASVTDSEGNVTYYATLQDAVNAAEDGAEIIVIADHELIWDGDTKFDSYPGLVVVAGKAVTIDLNGKVITVDTDKMSANRIWAVVAADENGKITMKDSSGEGTGAIEAVGDHAAYCLMMAYEDGTSLTVENGTYYLQNAIDSLLYAGGSTDNDNTDGMVTVTGGSFELGNIGTGENGKPWTFNVLGAGDHHASVTGGTFNADINRQHWSNEVLVPETHYTVENNDDTWTVKEGAVAYVYEGMVTGPYYAPKNIGYATFEEAVAAAVARNDKPVTLLEDIVVTAPIDASATEIVQNGYSITLKENGALTVSDASSVSPVAAPDYNLVTIQNPDGTTTYSVERIYTVTFETNGGSTVDAQDVVSGTKATKPVVDPTKAGYTFQGWYSDRDLTTEFSFDTEITADTTIYAKWEPVVIVTTGISLNKSTASLKVGNTLTLTATVTPDNATDKAVTWVSSNASVATVTADGTVTAVAAGTATITATASGGQTADCTVTVSRASSGGGGGGGSTSYTIAVEDTKNGDITVSPSRASSGSTVTITVDPDNGYELDELTVLDRNGKEIKLTKKSDSKYTFKMPSGKVTVEATFAEIEAFENPFTDVAEGAYYYDAVLWAAENGITGGTSATTFSPAVTCTRAQTVTFLWRAAGSPDPEGTNMPFTDVAYGTYYYDAVLWAVENGITSGTSATTFSPNATVTRAQNVTFLWRWAESPAAEQANPFVDVEEGKYYHDAVIWAAEQGITAGTTATTFSPDDPCLRSQIVTFLYRYLAK